MNPPELRIRFVNFWKSFDELDNFFLDIIRSRGLEPVVVNGSRSEVDLEIVSVYTNRLSILTRKASRRVLGLSNNPTLENGLSNMDIPSKLQNVNRRIWFTGENVRFPFGVEFDAYFSFDSSDSNVNNVYVPLWMLSINWFSGARDLERVGLPSKIGDLTSGRELTMDKSNLICAFVGNPEPVRLRSIQKLDEAFGVDKFGSFFGKPVPSKYPIGIKYKFSIAFENDLYPGYVTEKIVESYLAGTVPIYRGLFNKEAEEIFNPKAFINAMDFENDEELIDFIASMTDRDYKLMYCQPLFRKTPSLDHLTKVLLGD